MKAADLVKAAQRELALRHAVYPRQVMRGKMKQTQVDHELAAAQAWHSLSVLAPQVIDFLAAVTETLPEAGTPNERAIRELAAVLLGKLRTIVDG